MKIILLIASLIFSLLANAQIQIDVKTKSEFDSLFSIQPKDIQEKRYIEGFEDGFALVLDAAQDTLNINDYHPFFSDTNLNMTIVEIVDSTDEQNRVEKDTAKYNQWLSCHATLFKDTIYIGTYFGFFAGFGTITKINNGFGKSSYFEHIDHVDIYRKELSDKKDRSISVEAISENIILSNIPQKKGDVFYGKISFTTEPYYVDENYVFKNGYIHKRCRITFLFTCKLDEK